MYSEKDLIHLSFWDMTENYRTTAQSVSAEHTAAFGALLVELGRLTPAGEDYDALHKIHGLMDEAVRVIYIRPFEEQPELPRITVNRVSHDIVWHERVFDIDDFVVNPRIQGVRHVRSQYRHHEDDDDPFSHIDKYAGPILATEDLEHGWQEMVMCPGDDYGIDEPDHHLISDFPKATSWQRMLRMLGAVQLLDDELVSVRGRIDDTQAAALLRRYLEPLGANTREEKIVLPADLN